MRLMRKN